VSRLICARDPGCGILPDHAIELPGIRAAESRSSRRKSTNSGSYLSDDEVKRRRGNRSVRARSRALTTSIFASLTPWQVAQLARHPQRPYTLDYVPLRFSRISRNCTAIGCTRTITRSWRARTARWPAGAAARHQKGRDTKERVRRNYGMPKPEGYRKALRPG